MPTTVLLVHGTGVRGDSYREIAAQVKRALNEVAPGVNLEPCVWGSTLGATLASSGVSIPDFKGVVKLADGDAGKAQLALWDMLFMDPMFELRELAARPSVGVVPAFQQKALRDFGPSVVALGSSSAAIDKLPECIAVTTWAEAASRVGCSSELWDAATATRKIDTSLRVATARACVATAQAELAARQYPAVNARKRDALVDAVVQALGGVEMGLMPQWAKERLKGYVARRFTDMVNRKRDVLFSAGYPVAGDILRYQARGGPIREYIGQRIDACGSDVTVLAHSLGGIACVDLLVLQTKSNVKRLITVGSQAPLLYELGALTSLLPGDPLPIHFPGEWLNVFDRNDLLSYLAAPLFGPRAIDIEVNCGQPFPQAHSAYWGEALMWQQLAPYLNG